MNKFTKLIAHNSIVEEKAQDSLIFAEKGSMVRGLDKKV